MDFELTELDDWVGTLEELQLGLERKCPPTSANRLSSSSSKSCSAPHYLSRSPAAPPSPWLAARALESPPALPPRRDAQPPSPSPSPSPPPHVPLTATGKTAPPRRAEVQPDSRVVAPTKAAFVDTNLTQSIRASFNLLSCREATADNDLNCLLRQLEEVENAMKQLEQDDGDFTRRYSLASSSTTDPNTGCNPSPAPDAPEEALPPPLPPPLRHLTVNGHCHNGESNQQTAEGIVLRPAGLPRSLPRCPPSPPSADYESADKTYTAASASTNFARLSPSEVDPTDDASPDRTRQTWTERHCSMEAAVASDQAPVSRLLAFDSSTTGPSSSAALRPPVSQPLPRTPSGGATCTDNENSLSDKSISAFPQLSWKLSQVVDLADRLQLNKLVVRIFRPDRTTKAILIDQRMTAGEVASLMVEKNFLKPSIKLCLVEKVPSLKVERIFEESEIVADCILAWPIKSQNMIFFESRDDHFGFVESPKDWLGEAYASAHGFHSSDSVQKMLENFASSGLAEWHDFLYIRKPGEKTWTRRMCVLRNSGLYATRKNKKTFSASDLIRLLALDDKLHIYTTTGGWSRMRAPTPHGFALKTYAAQEFNSSHVFCFCAPDESALKQWACRLRLAKYGTSLLKDYQIAKARVDRSVDRNLNSPKEPIEKEQMTRQSSMGCVSSPPLQAPQPPIPRRQASAGNLHTVVQAPAVASPLLHPLGQRRITSPLSQVSTAFGSSQNLSLQNGLPKRHCFDNPPQHFFIR